MYGSEGSREVTARQPWIKRRTEPPGTPTTDRPWVPLDIANAVPNGATGQKRPTGDRGSLGSTQPVGPKCHIYKLLNDDR